MSQGVNQPSHLQIYVRGFMAIHVKKGHAKWEIPFDMTLPINLLYSRAKLVIKNYLRHRLAILTRSLSQQNLCP